MRFFLKTRYLNARKKKEHIICVVAPIAFQNKMLFVWMGSPVMDKCVSLTLQLQFSCWLLTLLVFCRNQICPHGNFMHASPSPVICFQVSADSPNLNPIHRQRIMNKRTVHPNCVKKKTILQIKISQHANFFYGCISAVVQIRLTHKIFYS